MILTDQNFNDQVEKNQGLVLVEFFAPWCGPCKMMVPIINELIEEYKNKDIVIGKLNVDEDTKIAEKYNIMSLPTLILFKQGKIDKQITGYTSKEDLKELIDNSI